MKSAIVTGATGFIGSALVRELIKKNIRVLALGRKEWVNVDRKRLQLSPLLKYIKLDMSEISDLDSYLIDNNWEVCDDCVFINFAWGGASKLSDLDIEAQMKNVIWSANALKIASKIKCSKFIHVGTMEEAFTSRYLSLDYNINSEYNRHVIYSVAKLVSRNVLKMMSYDLSIKLIIATNSHVMGPNDDKDSFLQVTLEKLVKGEDLVFSTGEQIFDVISVTDCARAYCSIAEFGKENSEYWIGSGNPRKLREYVEIMYRLYPSTKPMQFGMMPYNDISLQKSDFDIQNLVDDTGFTHSQTYEETVHELYKWLFKGQLNY
jgi:nucleoside-diphosphate-sugar epimerase